MDVQGDQRVQNNMKRQEFTSGEETIDETNSAKKTDTTNHKVDISSLGGVHTTEEVKLICALYDLKSPFDGSIEWNLNYNDDGTVTKNSRTILPLNPANYDKTINIANGTYGFIIPVVYSVDNENKKLWTFCAMKVSLVVVPAMRELTNTISFSNTMRSQQNYPSLNVIDGFSILNPSTCNHCNVNNDGENGYKSDLFAILSSLDINSRLPPPAWWLYWYSLIIFASNQERSRSFQNTFFSKVVDDIPEESHKWSDVTVSLHEDGNWYNTNNKNEDKLIVPEQISNYVKFTISYNVFKTLNSFRQYGTKKVTLQFPNHVYSEKLEVCLWNFMESKFSINNKTPQNSSRGRYSSLAEPLSLPQISFIIPTMCMLQSFMFLEIGDTLLTQIANINDGFKKFYMDNAKGTNIEIKSDQKHKFSDPDLRAFSIQKSVLRDKYLAYVPSEHRTVKSMSGYSIKHPLRTSNENILPANVFRFSALTGSNGSSKKTALEFFKKKGTKNTVYKVSYLVLINHKILNEVVCSKDGHYHSRKDSSLMLFWDVLRLKCIEHFSVMISNCYKPKNESNGTQHTNSTVTCTKLELDINKFVISIDRFNYASFQSAKNVIADNKFATPYLLYFSLTDMCHWYEENIFIRHIDFSSNGDQNYQQSTILDRSGSNSANNSPTAANQSNFRLSSSAPNRLVKYHTQTVNTFHLVDVVKFARNIFLKILLWTHTQALRALHSQKIVHADLHRDNVISFTAASIFRTDFTRYGCTEYQEPSKTKKTYIVPLGGFDNIGSPINPHTSINYIQEITIDSNLFPEFVLIDLCTAQISTIDFSGNSVDPPGKFAPYVPIWCFDHNKDTKVLPRCINYAKSRIYPCNGKSDDSNDITKYACAEIFGVYHKQPSTAYYCRASEQISVQTDSTDQPTAYSHQLITNMSDVYSLGIIFATMICGYLYRNSPRKWKLRKVMPIHQSEAQSFQSMSQLASAKPFYSSFYGVSVLPIKPDKSMDMRNSPKFRQVYDLQEAYLGHEWIKLIVDHDTFDTTVKDIESGNMFLNNNLGPAKSYLYYNTDKIHTIVEYMKKECVVKNDKWMFYDFSSYSSSDLSRYDNSEFVNNLSRIAKEILLDVDALGLPLEIHNNVLQVIVTEYANIKNTHAYEYDEKKTRQSRNNTIYYKLNSRRLENSIEKKDLVEIYTKAFNNLQTAKQQLLSTKSHRTMDKVLLFIGGIILENARSFVLEEKISRFENMSDQNSAKMRVFHNTPMDTLISRLKRRGWYRDTIRTTLIHQYGFGDIDAEQTCELVAESLSYHPGDRPSTLEFSHGLMFRDLKNFSMKSENIVSQKSVEEQFGHAKPIEEFLITISNYRLGTSCFCSDFISDHYISDVEKSISLLCKNSHPSGIINAQQITTYIEDISSIFLKYLSWYIPQINANALKALHFKEIPIYFLKTELSNSTFCNDKFPLLTREQMKTFFYLNMMSGQMSHYSLVPLYVPYLKKNVDLFVAQQVENEQTLLLFCEDFSIHKDEQKTLKKQRSYLEKFWQKIKTIYPNNGVGETFTAHINEDYPFLLLS